LREVRITERHRDDNRYFRDCAKRSKRNNTQGRRKKYERGKYPTREKPKFLGPRGKKKEGNLRKRKGRRQIESGNYWARGKGINACPPTMGGNHYLGALILGGPTLRKLRGGRSRTNTITEGRGRKKDRPKPEKQGGLMRLPGEHARILFGVGNEGPMEGMKQDQRWRRQRSGSKGRSGR